MDATQNQQVSSQFDTFINSLIDQKFAQQQSDLTPEVREELKNDLLRRLDEFLMARIIAALSDDEVAHMEKILQESKSQEEAQKFAVKHIPDFTTFVTNVFLEFQKIYLGVPQENNESQLSDIQEEK